MGWLRDMTAQWMRILTISGDKSMSMPEQARLISEVNGPVTLKVTLPPYRRRRHRAIADQAVDAPRLRA